MTQGSELERLQAAVKVTRRKFEATARGFANHPSAANFAGLDRAAADHQAACLEVIEFKRASHEAAARSDAWLRACERTA